MKKTISFAIIVMFSVLSAEAQIRIIGHRGVRHNTPQQAETPYYENTIPALQYCQTLGIYAAEFDVQLTSDNKVIVFHGPTIPGTNMSIWNSTFDQARSFTLPGGSRMPSLDEYLEQGKKCPQTKLICEIKKQPSPRGETILVEQVIAAVRRMGMEEQVEYTTFSEWALTEIHRIAPDAKVIFIDSGVFVKAPEYLHSIGANAVSYNFDGFMNNPGYAARAKELGMETTLWVVNDYEPVNWAILHGIDYISSDHPEIIKLYVDRLKMFER